MTVVDDILTSVVDVPASQPKPSGMQEEQYLPPPPVFSGLFPPEPAPPASPWLRGMKQLVQAHHSGPAVPVPASSPLRPVGTTGAFRMVSQATPAKRTPTVPHTPQSGAS
jgi:hypothetical protein